MSRRNLKPSKKRLDKLSYNKLDSIKSFLKGSKTFNKYHIELVFAQIGSGKSTDIARTCYKVLKSGSYSHVYTNIDINLSGVKTFNVDDFNAGKYRFPEDSLILIDEVSLLYDNRSYKSFPKAVGNYLRLSRHYKNSFIMYSQHYDCDKVIRTLASRLYYMRKVGFISFKRAIRKVISVVTQVNENTKTADSQVCDTLQFCSIFEKGAWQFVFIPAWTSLFDSYHIDDPLPPIPYKSNM